LFRFLPDYKAAAALAVGGPVKYVIRQGSGITDGWILQNVVPNIARKFPRQVAIVLGKAFLWAMYDDGFKRENHGLIKPSIFERVTAAFGHLEGKNFSVFINFETEILITLFLFVSLIYIYIFIYLIRR
jgi:hypothetical protein